MRDVVLALLLVAVVAITLLGYAKLNDQQRQIKELGARIDTKVLSVGLDRQAQCAAQAGLKFREENPGDDPKTTGSYRSHYNRALNVCLVLSNRIVVASGSVTDIKILTDAFEGTVLGDYLWINDKNRKHWEVKPVFCRLTTPVKEKKTCESDEGFEDLVKVYMEDASSDLPAGSPK